MKKLFLFSVLFLVIYSATAIALEIKIKEEAGGAVKTYYTSGTAACVGKPPCKTVKILADYTGQSGFIGCDKYIPSYLYAKANCGNGRFAWIRDGNLMQDIYYNDGNSACLSKWGRTCTSINYGNDRNVPYNDNSGCSWYFGSNFITAACDYSCTETTPTNALLCANDETGLTADTARTTVISCTTAKKCEYACSVGYTPSADKTRCITTCTPSYVNNCDSSDGCGNTRSTSPYNICNLATAGACGTESACSDSVDNNCNGESDYDSKDGRHGDNDCKVGVTGISVSNANPYVNTAISVSCTSNVANVNSISATLGGSLCTYNLWSGNSVSFTCNTGSSAGAKIATCYVDTTKSYKSGSNPTKYVNVQVPVCSSYSASSSCSSNTNCEWCVRCSNPFSTGQADACVTKGSCPARTCHKNQCGAACDNTVGGCPGSSCNSDTCKCFVDGACGTANGKTYPSATTSWGSDTFCSAGTTNPTNPTFPSAGGTTTWSCVGSDGGGTTASCSASRSTTAVNGVCGNGNVDIVTGESCDGTNLNGKTCATQGYSSGTLSCKPDCTFNTANCVSSAGCDSSHCNLCTQSSTQCINAGCDWDGFVGSATYNTCISKTADCGTPCNPWRQECNVNPEVKKTCCVVSGGTGETWVPITEL